MHKRPRIKSIRVASTDRLYGNYRSLTISIHASWLFSEETFAGDLCVCGDEIYGKGHRFVMVTRIDDDIIPSFKETDYKICHHAKK